MFAATRIGCPGFIAAGFLAAAAIGGAQNVQHLTVPQPGGMPGWPVLTGIERTTNGVRVTWDGPSGYYQLFQKSSLTGPQTWQAVGARTNRVRNATITTFSSNAFFRVSGPSPRYAGAQVCADCHANIHSTEMDTRHAAAFQTLKQIDQDKNPSCLPCHTVGYKLPTGFTSEANTPQLAGVQCESCHGPAANHAANETDPVVRPRVELAGQVCGGCHTGSHQPTFEEWSSSGHFSVVEDMSPSGRVDSCGRCHSGSARLTMLSGKSALAVTNDANVGITCVVCHDPHRNHVWTNVLTQVVSTNQIRYPVASTNDYSLSTSDVFTNKYNPNINVCAQCHNQRGASWTSTSRPPHHSPQYNMMLGTAGELDPGASRWRASHGLLIEKQCVGCHMQAEEYQSEAQPAVTGHRFEVDTYATCMACHPLPELLVDFTQYAISNRIWEVKSELDLWGTTKAPLALRTNYGALSWEYSTPGGLSSGTKAPTTAEQAQIPDRIKKARYNVYMVYHDGSFGVHNGVHSVNLLDAADFSCLLPARLAGPCPSAAP